MLIKTLNRLAPISSKVRVIYASFSTSVLPKEERIKVGDCHINYVKVGNGPHKVLCLPGALGSIWTDFKPQVEGFDRQQFTLVAWDPPGYGKSRPPERDFPTDFYVKDAENAYEFMKALDIPKYSLLGWSDGGISSMILAAKRPEAVQKLVVWGSNSFILPHELELYEKIRDINSWSKRMRDPMIEVYGEELFAKYWSRWVDGMVALFKANDGNICNELLKDIKCPTFILYGEKDPMVDKVHASHLHTNITGSRLKLYPKGKHNIHINFAEDFNKSVQEFLLQS
ncbi:hypothetical protein ABMA27_001675 [Loxostege sticticalis]|uniref:AB hydrolase-1 domain-containing protein n=1 Tax=Loxostege sticticalis TaxID=481309 RepID=A0ABR3HZH9_LOXSC